ncbi:MAG TPA: hypothetical protein VFO38_03960 [Candidatus Saccharimonadales bacterium]|nr:hypothetical protein [Candidatus Saccharimonadales bacterium]
MKEKFSVKQFNQQGFSGGLIIVIVAAVVILAAMGWQIYTSNQQPKQQSANNTSNTQKDPNEGYVVIKEWGVRFKPVEGLSGVEYFKPKGISTDAVTFTTQEIADKEPRCSEETSMMPFGLMVRTKEILPASGGVIAEIGDYKYQFRASDAACSEKNENIALENKIGREISQSVKSLEAAK